MNLFKTEKIYYLRPYATCHRTRWARRGPSTIAIEESVAFPEGGGQLPDQGVVRQGANSLTFSSTQKVSGRCVLRPDFPPIQAGGEVQIRLETPLSDEWDEYERVEVVIDATRRARLTRSHTAAHLVWKGLLTILTDAKDAVRGCYIEPDGGRFDLRTDRLIQEQVEEVALIANAWQEANYLIEMEALADEPDCRTWVSNGERIPCGGTHLPRTGLVGPLEVRRRSKGKNLERIYYTLTQPLPEEFLRMYEADLSNKDPEREQS